MAPRTVEAYHYDLERLRGFLESDTARRVDRVDDYDLKDYVATLKEEHDCKPATLSRTISSMRVFFSWLETEGHLDGNPARKLRNPKKGKRLPVYLTPTEARELLTRRDPEDPMDARNRTILMLLTMSGIRLSELVGLDISDLDFEQRTIKVMGKGRKERLVPMNSKLAEALEAWLAVRPAGQGGCRALFLDRHGNRVTPRMVQYAVRKAVKALGLDPRTSPHKLRHTYATNLYAEEVDLRDVQELLGHANISSTSIYTHTNVDKVRSAVEKLKLSPPRGGETT